jgi:uncharacterized secreted repeat protein (TIGR03808 family)
MDPARLSRRHLLAASLAVAVPGSARAEEVTARIQAALDAATAAGRPYVLPPGTSLVSALRLPDGAHLVGARGGSRLVLKGRGPLLTGNKLRSALVENVTFDGSGLPQPGDAGLVSFRDVADLSMVGCRIERASANGLMLERTGGRIRDTVFASIGRGALFSRDATGLLISDNRVSQAGENGIQIWRSVKSDDGSIVRGNRVEDVAANAPGNGQYGNAISVFRAGGVVISDNVIRRAAYTAVRVNSGQNVVISSNNIVRCGESAIFVEFAFDGAAITGNLVDSAQDGVHVANFADHGGRLVSVSGNLLRNLVRGKHPGDPITTGGRGIFVEADAMVSGNVIDRADYIGVQLGWGESLRDAAAHGNTIRDVGLGVVVSVAPGAGHASVSGNLISGAKRGAIVGMAWDKVVTGDLARDGVGKHAQIALAGNQVR